MKKYKIALAMILKDSEKTNDIGRCLDSLGKYIDGIYFTITYKNNDKKAKKLARDLSVFALSKGYPEPEMSYFKWVYDFSQARNYNWDQVSDDYDFIIWCDADDVWRGAENLQEACKLCDANKADCMFFNYLYSVQLDKDNKIKEVLIEHLRERLIRNIRAYKWVGEIHETLIEQRATVKMDGGKLCDVVHLSNDERRAEAMDRNIEILEKILDKQGNNQDPRIVYYLGKAFFDKHQEEYYKKAEELIKRYLEGSDQNTRSGWEEERAQAWEYLSEIARIGGHFGKAVIYASNALIENPKFPQFYIDLALCYVYLKRWDKAIFWADLAQKVPYPKTTLVLNPRDMKVRLLEVYFNVAVNTDDIEKANWAMEKLSEIFPDDPGVKERLMAAKKAKTENETVHRIVMLTKFLNDVGEKDKVEYLLKAVPDGLSNLPVIASIRNDFVEPRKWGDNEIAIMCGRGFEKWSPDNLEKGIGGSEEAVIHMAKRLHKLGWEVTVFADPQDPKDYDGVHYRPFFEFNGKDEFNILIGWRVPQFFENKWNAKKTYLWLHDVQNPLEYTETRVNNINKIMVLSEAHKKTLINDWNKAYLTDDKFMLTGNGIDVDEIATIDEKKDPYRVIWTSSYDRGIDHLLNIWGDVKKEVPEANLHIFYGWNLFDAVYLNNPERQAWKAKINKLMAQEGVEHHGRVGQHEILKETAKAGIWAYPTHFYEISCITAMKCQALGAIPVTCDYAALKETVQYGFKLDVSEKDIYDKDKLEEYKKELIKMLKKSPTYDRKKMIDWSRNKFSWDKVASQWSKEFKK